MQDTQAPPARFIYSQRGNPRFGEEVVGFFPFCSGISDTLRRAVHSVAGARRPLSAVPGTGQVPRRCLRRSPPGPEGFLTLLSSAGNKLLFPRKSRGGGMGHLHSDKHFRIQRASRVRRGAAGPVPCEAAAGGGEGRAEGGPGAGGCTARPASPRRFCHSPAKFGGASSPRLNDLRAISAQTLPKDSLLCCFKKPSSRQA